jgi:hypothetical protein
MTAKITRDGPEICEVSLCTNLATHEVWNRQRDGMGFRTGLRQRLRVCLDCARAILADAKRSR